VLVEKGEGRRKHRNRDLGAWRHGWRGPSCFLRVDGIRQSRCFAVLRLRLDSGVNSGWIKRRKGGLVDYAQTMLEQPV